MTHFDYVRQIKELTEFADFTVLNLSDDVDASGIRQYYSQTNQLEKLLRTCNEARLEELGKTAALDYEKFLMQ